MLDRILLVTDLSAESAAAWEVAIELVQRTGRAEFPVLYLAIREAEYAQIEAPRVALRLYDDARRAADEAMRRYVGICSDRGIRARPIVRAGPSTDCIASTAQAELADLIVLGMREPGVINRLLGSSIAEVARASQCHVLYVKPSKP
jgi:nucleotide-binding universal stress UspA family protein